jgi:hypothetical protein
MLAGQVRSEGAIVKVTGNAPQSIQPKTPEPTPAKPAAAPAAPAVNKGWAPSSAPKPAPTAAPAQAAAPTVSLTPHGAQLKRAGEAAAKLPLGATRADAFGKTVLPTLLNDASRMLNTDPKKLEGVLARVVSGSGSDKPTLGLKPGDKGLAADTNYPPRAANAVWKDFAAALGISKEDAAAVTDLNAKIGAYPKPEGKYAPDFAQLSPDLQKLATRVSQSLLGQQVSPPLSSKEQAFKANLVLNNLTWHSTNWQRASGDATRANPLERNNVFNTYSDNLRYASERGGMSAVIDMAISDAFNAGKPGVGAAEL